MKEYKGFKIPAPCKISIGNIQELFCDGKPSCGGQCVECLFDAVQLPSFKDWLVSCIKDGVFKLKGSCSDCGRSEGDGRGCANGVDGLTCKYMDDWIPKP